MLCIRTRNSIVGPSPLQNRLGGPPLSIPPSSAGLFIPPPPLTKFTATPDITAIRQEYHNLLKSASNHQTLYYTDDVLNQLSHKLMMIVGTEDQTNGKCVVVVVTLIL